MHESSKSPSVEAASGFSRTKITKTFSHKGTKNVFCTKAQRTRPVDGREAAGVGRDDNYKPLLNACWLVVAVPAHASRPAGRPTIDRPHSFPLRAFVPDMCLSCLRG